MQKKYLLERDGQIEFFDNYGIPWDDDEHSVLVDNTDGVWNGVLFEFKLNITNLNRVLFQAIKYLSRMRIRGESVPATILLVSLNDTTAYVYKSEDYRDAIQTVYVGGASKDNEGFVAGQYDEKLDYSDMCGSDRVHYILFDDKEVYEQYMPIDIDENCIVGWAERYYRDNPKAQKGDFIGDEIGTKVKIVGEIREPKYFRYLINPYIGKTNEQFKFLMDKLNDRLTKKSTGAFYTPMPYAKKAVELVKMAVDRVPDGNDYVIIDRCAGTGNLEEALLGENDKNGSPLIEHCIASTYEYYEYKVLYERLHNKHLRHIIPPTEMNVEYKQGFIVNADAMSREFIENQKIKQYIDNPNCTIILFENPPFFDTSSMTFTENTDLYVRAKSSNRDSYVCSEFKKNIFKYGSVQASAREISNLFIWSAFTYYCRQNTDSYIVFSPVKYFKSVGLVSQRMLKGFAFNRVHFTKTNVSSGSKSVISCVLWANETSSDTHWDLDVFDIDDDHIVDMDKIVQIRRVYNSIVAYNDKRVFPDDVLSDVVCNSDGTENLGWRHKTKHSRYNANIVCYMASNGFIPDVKHRYLSRCGDKSGIEQSYGFMVRADNYLQKLPMWVAKLFPAENWFDIDVYFNTSDGGDAYTKDLDFLKSCLIYTCLSNQNKCLTFDGSDGRYYRNELCFDTDTLASRDLKSMTLDDEENSLMDLWYMILDEAKVTANYNPAFTYGVYQITKELNTFHDKIQSNGKVKKVPDYIELNGYLDSLRTKLKEYYKSHITEKMFEYELLK